MFESHEAHSPSANLQIQRFSQKHILFHGDQAKFILCSDSSFLLRTVFIIASLNKNKFLFPAAKSVILFCTSRKYDKLFESDSKCLLSPEDVTILFLHFTLNVRKHGAAANEAEIKTAEHLLLSNHFEQCAADKCEHLFSAPDDSISSISHDKLLLSFFGCYSDAEIFFA